eukprot:EG_transcript_26612
MSNPKTHYLEFGINEGVAMHPGREVVKVVLMHKDQWPLLQLWVLYHAHVFGFRNLIVLDESSQDEPLAFLQEMRLLGMTVLKTSGGLNNVFHDLNHLFDRLRWSADYFIKLDTDEFLISFDKVMSIDVNEMFKSIRSAKLNGHRSRILTSFYYQSGHGCCAFELAARCHDTNDTNACWPLGETFKFVSDSSKAFLPAS